MSSGEGKIRLQMLINFTKGGLSLTFVRLRFMHYRAKKRDEIFILKCKFYQVGPLNMLPWAELYAVLVKGTGVRAENVALKYCDLLKGPCFLANLPKSTVKIVNREKINQEQKTYQKMTL